MVIGISGLRYNRGAEGWSVKTLILLAQMTVNGGLRQREVYYLGVSFNSLLVNGVWGDTAEPPLSVNT
jgi:hypothetical protein